jgi:hypothetical protein
MILPIQATRRLCRHVFNAYFVGVVAGGSVSPGMSTLLWTSAVGIANAAVLISAPLIGAVADNRAAKKKIFTGRPLRVCFFTALLALTGPGDIRLAVALIIISVSYRNDYDRKHNSGSRRFSFRSAYDRLGAIPVLAITRYSGSLPLRAHFLSPAGTAYGRSQIWWYRDGQQSVGDGH